MLGTGTQLAAQTTLSITKMSSTANPVHLGDAIQYNLTVSNISGAETNNQVMITDEAPMNTTLVPGSLSYVSGIPPSVSSPLSPNWIISQLLPGESTTVTFSVTVNLDNVATSIMNTAAASSMEESTFVTSGDVVHMFAPPIATSNDCVCNNDQTPNMVDGTFSTTLIISNPDDSALPSGLNFVFDAITGLTNSAGGSLAGASFLYCNGVCPSGVSAGEYYIEVIVDNTGAYAATIDGPDMVDAGEIDLGSQNCTVTYPALPDFPMDDMTCITMDTIFGSDMSVYREEVSGPCLTMDCLPVGFTQTGTGDLMVSYDDFDPITDYNTIPPTQSPYKLFLIRTNADGCKVASSKEFFLLREPIATIVPTLFECREDSAVVNLYEMFPQDYSTDVGGSFTVNGDAVEKLLTDGTMGPTPLYTLTEAEATNGFFCKEVIYTVSKENCQDKSSQAKMMVTFMPKPEFEISTSSPVCNDGKSVVVINIAVNSTGPNQTFDITSNNAEATAIVNNAEMQIELSTPPMDDAGSYTYNICLVDSLSAPLNCTGVPMDADMSCFNQTCKKFVVYNDGYGCGAEGIFPDDCDVNAATPCEVVTNPTLKLACGSLFTISLPFDLLTTDVDMDDGVIPCSQEMVSGHFNASFLGIDVPNGGGPNIEDLPGIGTLCDIFGFCIDLGIFEICPLKSIYNLLQCDKSLLEMIFDGLAFFVGGNGGAWKLVADTDGDGAFDYIIEGDDLGITQGFPSSSPFTIPNNVVGNGTINVRLVAAWPNAPSAVCGPIVSDGISLLELLPIGAIPVVGAIIEDVLAALNCDINMAWSNSGDATVTVKSYDPPIFANCNTDGYVFAQSLICNIASNWSIPTVHSSCDEHVLPYMGIVNDPLNPLIDTSMYSGTSTLVLLPAIIEEGIYQTFGPVPGSLLPPGVYKVEYTAVSCNGNPEKCTFNVSVTSEAPTLVVPNDLTIGTDVDQCTAFLNGLVPYQGVGGCFSILNYSFNDAVSGTLFEINSMTPGDINVPDSHNFEVGETEITYTLLNDSNQDGDFDDPLETQIDNFTITVEDNEKPHAVCVDLVVQLDNAGSVTIYADQMAGSFYVDGGSSDNCVGVDIQISKDGTNWSEFLDFDCSEEGANYIRLRVIDDSMNESVCFAIVNVVDFFDGYELNLDAPETCLEPFGGVFDLEPYIAIVNPEGNNILHANVGTLGPDVVGAFGISAFLPDIGSTNDPGSITQDGLYTLGTGSGYVTVSYVLAIGTQINQQNGQLLTGCFVMVHDVFEIRQPLTLPDPTCECIEVENRIVDLGTLTGGREPYTIQYTGASLDVDRDGIPDDFDGSYLYTTPDHTITDFSQDLGILRVNYTEPVWSVTLVDARGCELFTSGSCDNADLLEGPEIDCMGANDFDTEVIVCERQYEWFHALPYDNCAVTQYSYTITNPDGTIEGPFYLDALIDSALDGVPLAELFEAEYEFENGTSTVSYYAEDAVGNHTTCSFNVTVEDNDPPYFINCPYPRVIQNTETDQCDAFVNFALPLAEDNCVMPVVTQIDGTGLSTGDRFPIGTTILIFQAVDGVGNKTICEVKVTVNHFDHVPTITCPGDVTQTNDDWLCGAVVKNIGALAEELCADELVKTYQIVQDGAVVGTGLDDASDNFFDVGTSTVTYRIQNQPLLMISEITQDADALI
ncbi:MAG: putative repeat protein (TIGR01451 family), partial [Halioglobus sp.]